MPAAWRSGDAGTEGARARRAMAAGALGCVTTREGLASSSGSGRSDASRGEEGRRRREEGRPGGGRAEGGAQTRGGGLEGQRGREAGSVGGEGEEERAGAGPGREKGKRERRIRGVEEDPGVHSFSLAIRFPLSPPRLPSLLGPGLEPQTLRHNSPAGCAKLSANFTAWRGGGARLTQAARPGPLAPPASRLFLPTSSAAATSTRSGTPPPAGWGRGGAQGSATRAKMGEGEAGSLCLVRSANVCKSCFSICVNPVSASLSQRGVVILLDGGCIQKARENLSLDVPEDSIALTSNRTVGGSQRIKWKFHKREDKPQLFRIMQQVTAAQSPGLRGCQRVQAHVPLS